jgi:hypothetical protein
VALVDELLDRIAADDAPPAFLLDGQAAVLDDYLAARPERRAALAAALGGGRLEAGPWYVLADTLIPGAEPLVRNLLAGRRAVRALGAEPPPVLYCPDSFGHPAALPTLAAGFGLGAVVVWRGYGGARWPAGDAAWWRAPDGARALLVHLPPDGYEFGSRLPPALPSARERWAAMRAVLAPRARLGVALVTNGADHHALQERWGEAVDALARAAAPEPVRVASLGDVARLTLARAGERDAAADPLPEAAGELRDSYGYAWTLQGTFASRAAQKRRAAHAAGRLVRDVEPWAALAALRAGDAGAGRPPRALLRAAWRPLLECLPHDTLCGCSTDEVARAPTRASTTAQPRRAGCAPTPSPPSSATTPTPPAGGATAGVRPPWCGTARRARAAASPRSSSSPSSATCPWGRAPPARGATRAARACAASRSHSSVPMAAPSRCRCSTASSGTTASRPPPLPRRRPRRVGALRGVGAAAPRLLGAGLRVGRGGRRRRRAGAGRRGARRAGRRRPRGRGRVAPQRPRRRHGRRGRSRAR